MPLAEGQGKEYTETYEEYMAQEAEAAEARLYWLLRENRCLRCESTSTFDVTGEYDAVCSRRCTDCGYKYVTEF